MRFPRAARAVAPAGPVLAWLTACSAPPSPAPFIPPPQPLASAREVAASPPLPVASSAPPAPAEPPTPFLRDVVQLSVGLAHACAVTSRQRVVCWGDNAAGQLGVGVDLRSVPGDLARPHVVGGLPPIASVAAGSMHTCAIGADGSVWCWGSAGADLKVTAGGAAGSIEQHGQWLGTPVRMPFGREEARVIALASPGDSACAAFANDVRCWSTFGTIAADGTRSTPPSFVVTPLADVTALATDQGHVCAVARGEVWCWSVSNPQPARAARVRGDTTTPAKVAIGQMYACVASMTGELRCWWSLIGDFWQKPPSRDVRWPKKSPTRDVAVGDSPVCTTDREGRVDCFLSEEGGLTDQATAQSWATKKLGPHPIAGVDGATTVGLGTGRDVFGYGFGCALRSAPDPRGAQVFCWGGNESGQLGTGDHTSTRTAVPVVGAR